ncbi:MAG: thiol-activated cytolysin family protein [Mangrovibacterium sp.]
MKTILLRKPYAMMALICTFMGTACNDDSSDPYTLQKVEYEQKSSEIISTQKTGETVYDPTTSSFKEIYAQTTKNYMTVSSPSILSPTTSSEVIYPGSILRGSSFLNYNYDPLVLSNEFKPVTLSLSLKGANSVFSVSIPPTLSDIRGALSALLLGNQDNVDYSYVPADYSFSSDSISNEDSFTRSFSTHVDANILNTLVSVDFGYSQNTAWEKKQNYVMVKLIQKVYSASINPKYVTDWVDGDIILTECGTHEPLYISNVDYGRTAYLLMETDMSTSEAATVLSMSVSVALKVLSASAGSEYTKKLKDMFTNKKITVKIIGGSAAHVTKVTSYEEFVNYITNISTAELVKASAPISYTVRRLMDNTRVDIVEPYTEVTHIVGN